MKTLGNILWFILIGAWLGLCWVLIGILWCITIIGIPVGIQCFKVCGLAFLPFNKEVIFGPCTTHFILNVIWVMVFGVALSVVHIILAGICFITIIGIPFGKQLLKMAKICFMPFGTEIITQ